MKPIPTIPSGNHLTGMPFYKVMFYKIAFYIYELPVYTQFILTLVSTIFIELLVARLVARKALCKDNSWKDSATAIIAVNLISFPLAWALYRYSYVFTDDWVTYFSIELFVIVLEAILLKTQLNLNARNSFYISFCMNATSAAIGVILWNISFVQLEPSILNVPGLQPFSS